jgi:hypothetical protein
VLRTYRSIIQKPSTLPYKADPVCVEALNKIISETNARIVVSSSWRGKFIAPMRRMHLAWGVRGKVVCVTPRLDDRRGANYVARARGGIAWFVKLAHTFRLSILV